MHLWSNYTSQLKGITGTDYDLLDKTAGGIVLDAGCGLGGHLDRLSFASLRVGIDPGLSGLKRGSVLFPKNSFVCAEGHRLPFSEKSFDSVICIDVIEHVDYPIRLLSELKRILKENGIIFLQTPNYPIKRLYDFWHWLRRSKDTYNDDPTHISKLNVHLLRKYFNQAGFKIITLKARNLPFQNAIPYMQKLKTRRLFFVVAQKIVVVAQRF